MSYPNFVDLDWSTSFAHIGHMNPGVMIAIHAAAAAEKAKTQVLDAFRVHGATAPDRVCTLADLGLTDNEDAVAKLISAGVIRGVDSRGRLTVLGDSIDRVAGYYLDEPAFIALRDGAASSGARKQAVAIVCAFVAVAVVAILAVMIARG